MIIGVTGFYGSGKDTLANHLEGQGFEHHSLSDEVRKEVLKNNLNLTRENQIEIANQIRKTKGSDYFAKKVIEKIEKNKTVITSIRNEQELLELRKLDNFILINTVAPVRERFDRIKKRKRYGDPKTLEELKKKEKQEQSNNPSNQQLHIITKSADIIINNNGTLKDLENKIDKFLRDWEPKLSKKNKPIEWDTYFMGIALLSAKRSKDPNTQVGACIINQEKKIIGIGYNGFPRGCPDDKLPWAREAENKNDTKYPYVVHAEANAILNSTRELKNSKIYVALFPCNECAKLIIQSGMQEVIYLDDKYNGDDAHKASIKLLKMAGIKIRKLENKTNKIELNFENGLD
ncbi:AAA family ATPase [Candidatus Woesearchaeota archaeon]|jgi:dCMP deaminase|nr:AAA family ATPase [Candidatus Woesearchaeota archaeon]MBT4835088.1 AAA family ATPase [Candidatus Woesearchaeota archaeon]MBT6734786.1 AAA family ATPase [Candidatus Woesearchaeota archaeon]MBT7170031.1 AAA family ATPase [Candidatus Woesearchaeota archaeon]MBT7474874.1 AAA family ATPase [Candidatus Woesearchaeota archaeon]